MLVTGGVIRGGSRFAGATGATAAGGGSLACCVATGVTRGGTTGRLTGGANVGAGFTASSLVLEGGAVAAGVFTSIGEIFRRGCCGGVFSAAGDSGLIVAAGAGGLGIGLGFRASSGLRGMSAFSAAEGSAMGAIEGDALTGTDGEGRILTVEEGDTGATEIDGEAVGTRVGAGEADAVGAKVARAENDGEAVGARVEAGEGDAAGAKVARGVIAGDGRTLGDCDGEKATVALGRTVGAIVAMGAGVAVAAVAGVAAGVVAAAAVAVTAGELEVSAGFTNFFGGALGGAVASDLILVRVRSAAERSAIAVQPVSITTSETLSLMLRGRWNPETLLSSGTVIWISSPRIVAERVSAFISECRRRRYRSSGWRLRVRNSS